MDDSCALTSCYLGGQYVNSEYTGMVHFPMPLPVMNPVYNNPMAPVAVYPPSSSCSRLPLPRQESDPNLSDRERRIINKRSAKERRRNLAINNAFEHLQKIIPFTPEPKLAKIKTLNLATKYIQFLNDCLKSPEPIQPDRIMGQFAREVVQEVQNKNSYTHRAEEYMGNSTGGQFSVKSEEEDHLPGWGARAP